MRNLSTLRWGDRLAVPFFLVLFYYFARIPERTWLETTLLLFSGTAFVFDVCSGLKLI